MNQVAQESEGFGQSGDKAVQDMQELLALSKHMEGTVSASARSFIELAKMDHLVFKFDVYKTMMGLTQSHKNELASHQSCRLGQWYYQGEGKQCFAKLPEYKEVEKPHQQVHEAGKSAVNAIYQGIKLVILKNFVFCLFS